MSSFVPKSRSYYKKTLPFTINTNLLVKSQALLQIGLFALVILYAIINGNPKTPSSSNVPSSMDNNSKPSLLSDQKSATGKRQVIYSLFDVINHNNHSLFKSMYFIGTALTTAFKFQVYLLFSLIAWKLFRDSNYSNINTYTKLSIGVYWIKFLNWVIANYITIDDSQKFQSKSFLGYLIFSNVSYYGVIFKVVDANIGLFKVLNKSSNFNSGSLPYRKLFKLPISPNLTNAMKRMEYHQFLKISYFLYTFLQLYLFRSYYYHQISNDLSYLNLYNTLSWIVVICDVVLDNWVINIFGLGSIGSDQETGRLQITGNDKSSILE
ncbi:hypothetical protein DASC09_038790 [Saccharomycopsis crataegensis]|uniref:Uncharacterized protein n=1 Tax=Saccharomycopsis crataegensis TaxID=43959 RepID=A0AAV5QQ62_9ASCO|nr:hypothetical protein DASC09_038790 [Saccharomycopsis crataegensis]